MEVAPLPRLSRNGVENLHISSLHFFFHTFVKWYIMPGVLCLLGRTRVVCLASLRPRASSFSSWLWDPSPDNPAVQIKDFLLHCNGGTPPQTILRSRSRSFFFTAMEVPLPRHSCSLKSSASSSQSSDFFSAPCQAFIKG